MIKNFEEITCGLTSIEKKIIPVVISKLKQHSIKNPIKSFDLIKFINKETGVIIAQPRFRKICNFIRSNGILPIIATSKGYYVSRNKIQIQNQIQSLLERSDAIAVAAYGLQSFITKTKK